MSIEYPVAALQNKVTLNCVNDRNELLGVWVFESVVLPVNGVCRKNDDKKTNFFVFQDDRQAVVHINGKIYETTYSVKDGQVSFDDMELASLCLSQKHNTLQMKNHLGAILVFRRCQDKIPTGGKN